ncbi:stretch-activated cation channel mid1 [Onygenales sp. PD_12]|nr:stretch-activated cation channel mid1 [Emmonsiellopsis sp. PD_33]KAK2785032.1 stretch-activated cation channel mid1 [Onygenales sp. PD_12]
MPCPKLSPLQSRFAASLAATLFLIALYLILSSPSLAYAIDVDSIIHADHNHPVSFDLDVPPNLGTPDANLTPDFDSNLLDGTSNIERRAPDGVVAFANNAPETGDLDLGETHHFMFPEDALAGPKSDPTPGLPPGGGIDVSDGFRDEMGVQKRDDNTLAKRATTVYITANTCAQPSLNATQEARDAGPPQLKLYVSQSESVQRPGPDTNSNDVTVVEFNGGYASTILSAQGSVYIGVSAPSNSRYSGKYKYEIAASIDERFHKTETSVPYLFFVDGDSDAALLQTEDFTQANPDDDVYIQWMNLDPPPFTIFAHNMNDTSILGLQKSFCGLKANAQIRKRGNDGNVQVSMTNRGSDKKPKEQFYIKGLNRTSAYYGFLAMEGNSTQSGSGVVGGGGKVWKSMNFTTKSDNNCAVLYNLDFCSEIAYAVPSHPSMKVADLSNLYDTHAASLYKNFTRSLEQIACNAPTKSQYSLATNCSACADAYKQWLCAVTIPRCEDYSSNLHFLQPRNTAQDFINGSSIDQDHTYRQVVLSNSSRNPLIDEEIKPGPYKEVLPCQDLCYDLVRSCPAALGFSCPEGKWLNASYGAKSANGDITCSYLGAAYFKGGAWRVGERVGFVISVLVGFWAVFWML